MCSSLLKIKGSFQFWLFFFSQTHRMDGNGRHLRRSPCPAPLPRAAPTTAGSLGLCSGKFWLSPRMETLQLLWAVCAVVWPVSQSKGVVLCLNGISCISVCACYSFCSPELRWTILHSTNRSGTYCISLCSHGKSRRPWGVVSGQSQALPTQTGRITLKFL